MFTAEQIVEKGRNFHLACFTCNDCKRPLRNKLQVCVNNEEIYCNTCHSKNSRAHGQAQSDPSLIKGTESDSCPRCEGKVFEAEKMQSSKFMFHKSCFNCCQCKHMLDYSSMFECKAGEIYCKGCYINLFWGRYEVPRMEVEQKLVLKPLPSSMVMKPCHQAQYQSPGTQSLSRSSLMQPYVAGEPSVRA